jgi:hypothetical protein
MKICRGSRHGVIANDASKASVKLNFAQSNATPVCEYFESGDINHTASTEHMFTTDRALQLGNDSRVRHYIDICMTPPTLIQLAHLPELAEKMHQAVMHYQACLNLHYLHGSTPPDSPHAKSTKTT